MNTVSCLDASPGARSPVLQYLPDAVEAELIGRICLSFESGGKSSAHVRVVDGRIRDLTLHVQSVEAVSANRDAWASVLAPVSWPHHRQLLGDQRYAGGLHDRL
jgi:hypothetical protein